MSPNNKKLYLIYNSYQKQKSTHDEKLPKKNVPLQHG